MCWTRIFIICVLHNVMYYICMNYMCNTPKLTIHVLHVYHTCNTRVVHFVMCVSLLGCGFQQSVWSEMWEELRFAIRCHGSSKKPALKRQCSKCMHHPGDSCAVDSPNGIIHLREVKRSPVPPRDAHFHYHDAQIGDVYSRPEYRDTQAWATTMDALCAML